MERPAPWGSDRAFGEHSGTNTARLSTLLLHLHLAPGQFLDVMQQAVRPPRHTRFAAPAQRETVQPLVVSNVAKHGLHRAEALAVAAPALVAADAILHRLE